MQLNKSWRKRIGLSLVELLVALAVNAIAITALVKIFSESINNYNNVVNADTLYQQLETAIQLMTMDIRRAGYWSNASTIVNANANNNPFQAAGNDISISGSCILFTYDTDNSGSVQTVGSGSDDEHYGFRLINQTLQTRPSGSTWSCTAASNNWDNVTNPSIVQITNLTFTLNTVVAPIGATANYMQLRTITISITGNLVANPATTATMTQTVRLRNDKFVA